MASSVRVMLGWVQSDSNHTINNAVNGVRMVSAALGNPIDTQAAHDLVVQAQSVERGGDPPVIGHAETQGQLQRAARVAENYGLTLVTDSGDMTPEELFEQLGGEADEDALVEPPHEVPEFDPDDAPSYRAGLLALTMMAATDGNAAGALQLANTLRHAYNLTAGDDEDAADDWDDVLRTLFDAFPVHADHGDVRSLAREVGR
jgi:hypothetical protein